MKITHFTRALVISLILSSIAFAGEVLVQVNGMVCSSCATKLKKKLSQEPSVQSVDVNLDEKLLKVKVKDGQTLSDEKIRSHIESAGFSTVELKRI